MPNNAGQPSALDDSTTVSVVIPTIGRPELARAIASAKAQQTDAVVEVVVVYDGPEDAVPEAAQAADVVLATGGGARGSAARNRGVASSAGRLVAFLDDDDEWLPTKLRDQLALLDGSSDAGSIVVAGRHVHVDARTGDVSEAGPTRLIREDESVEEYLFRRRPPHGGRPSMYTSTLLCSRELALAVPWDETLPRHQDWDWLVRLGRRPGVVFRQPEPALVRIQTGSDQSISASAHWRPSLSWADGALRDSPAVYADFIAAQTLRYALQARDWKGVATVARALWRARRLPSLQPMIIGVAGLLPRRTIERITSRTVRRQP